MRIILLVSLVMGTGLFLFTNRTIAREPVRLTSWVPQPADWKGATHTEKGTLLTGPKWSFLTTPDNQNEGEITATITVREASKLKSFFGQSWSVWPDKMFADGGWDGGLLLHSHDGAGYRVQLSASLGEIALVKYPHGGYVRSVPHPVKTGELLTLTARVQGGHVTVEVAGKELFSFHDEQPLSTGRIGVGVHGDAKVEFTNVAVTKLPVGKPSTVKRHTPNFNVRKWVGERMWVFDGLEPIMLLPDPASHYINNVKLRPGVRPLLSFNSHWDVQNQGAYKEAENATTEVKTSGRGKELQVDWVGKHIAGRFATRSTMTIGWDAERNVYTYDIASELEVKPGEPFHFRYGFDFEHHTPLDPFNWKYLLFRKTDGTLARRPVTSVDPGPQTGLETSRGLRLWHGRHADPVPVCPAVEYHLTGGSRAMSTAVCAAFYDTGVAFPAETLKPNEPVRVRYRYTGYPAEEAARLFEQAKTYDAPTLDPKQHYIFAQWPAINFAQAIPLSEPFAYGQVPFMTGHNQRPNYTWFRDREGYAMKLGPQAFGAATLPTPDPLPIGRYALSVLAKGDRLHGPGGRIEITASDKDGKVLQAIKHFVGAGSFEWKEVGLLIDIPEKTKSLRLGFGNRGTGDFYIRSAQFVALRAGEQGPPSISATANSTPAKPTAAPAGAIADYRFAEGRGLHAFDFAQGPFGVLELANLDWVKDGERNALRFADQPKRVPTYPIAGSLDLYYLRHPSYKGRDTLPVATAGHHGWDFEANGFTIVSWIKPAAAMGQAEHGGKGDIVGVGARRIILRLVGAKAPYQLQAAINVNDLITANTKLNADQWYQVAVSGTPSAANQWKVRLFVDGQEVHEGTTTKPLPKLLKLHGSVVLGTELFYFHDAYYRGLIGRTLVFDRPLDAKNLAALRPTVD